MNSSDHVILVDANDQAIGTKEKLTAHIDGTLHRAFSIFIFSKMADEWTLLLQQRHPDKYHSSALWTNTCCSHPRPNESTENAAIRRLNEEMGLTDIPLTHVGHFIYQSKVSELLIEHEYDHVFVGFIEKQEECVIKPNPQEVADWQWIKLVSLEQELRDTPEKYTAWFGQAYGMARGWLGGD